MSGWDESAITITTLLPVAGALVIIMVPKEKDRLVRALGILFTGAALVLAVAIAIGFDYGKGGLQYVLDVSWISAIGARYHVGIDGLSMPLYVLTFAPVVPVRDLHLALRARSRTDQGVPGADAAARDRDGGHVHRVRPDPVLRLLGAGPGPDVLPDRDLGLREPPVRLDQVLPLHAVRFGLHAPGVPRHVLQGARPAHVRHGAAPGVRVRPAGSRTTSSWWSSARSRSGSR